MRDISESEFEQITTELISQLPDFRDLFGIKIRRVRKISAAKKKRFYGKFKALIKQLQTLNKYRTIYDDPSREVERLQEASDFVCQQLRIPKGMYYAEYKSQQYLYQATAPFRKYYFKGADPMYNASASKIARLLFEKNSIPSFAQLLHELANSPDGKPYFQSLATRVPKQINYLRRRKRSFRTSEVAKLVEIYRELAGIYEKLIRVVVGCIFMLEGGAVPYVELARRQLKANTDMVVKRFPSLTKDFNIVARNAIAHTNYTTHPSNNSIKFVDRRSTCVLSFDEFFEACRKLSSLILALSTIETWANYEHWKNNLNYYLSVKARASSGEQAALK